MELKIDSASALDMATTIFGAGVTVVSASYAGQSNQVGIYSGAFTTMPGVAPSDTGLILSTGWVDSFTNSSGDANLYEGTSTDYGAPGDAMLDAVSGQTTQDAAVLSATFVPTGNVLTMQLVFSSEEYLEYVRSGFNDALAIWVNNVPATLTVGTGDITIDNINDRSNENLYVNNPADADTYNTEMDGFTVTLTLKVRVNAGVENSFRLAIGDAGDGFYDSAVLVAANSVQVALIATDDALTLQAGSDATLDLLGNDRSSSPGTLTVTKINGVAVTAGSVVTLPTGDSLALDANGQLTVYSAGHADHHVLTYEVTDSAGITDVAFVTLNIVACFTEGTEIAVPGGVRRIEELRAGDRVKTANGPQALCWVGRVVRKAEGHDAPVEIAAGTFGPHRSLRVSPNHRVVVGGARAELLFGAGEVLVKAKHLVDGVSVRRVEGGTVTYLHLLFNGHEIVTANGLACESYYPSDATTNGFDAETQEELFRLFPHLHAGGDFGPLAKPEISRHEAQLLRA